MPLQPKQITRRAVREARAARTPAERSVLAQGITQQLIDLCEAHNATALACYSALPDEPDTLRFLEWAQQRGIKVLLPIAQTDHTLQWAALPPADPAIPLPQQLTAGAFGITAPTTLPLPSSALTQLDLIVVPACAVDFTGVRLGWGRGYYDRCLAGLTDAPPVFAVVYEAELVPELPRDSHDQPVYGVVTEQRWARLPLHRHVA